MELILSATSFSFRSFVFLFLFFCRQMDHIKQMMSHFYPLVGPEQHMELYLRVIFPGTLMRLSAKTQPILWNFGNFGNLEAVTFGTDKLIGSVSTSTVCHLKYISLLRKWCNNISNISNSLYCNVNMQKLLILKALFLYI